MRGKILDKMDIPSGIECAFKSGVLTCTKGSVSISRKMSSPRVSLRIHNNSIILECEKANKIQNKIIKAYVAHIKNIFAGLNEKFVYTLESANVHFPMTIKVDSEYMTISNFLGEKVSRKAKILPNVKVEVKGSEITVSSHDKDAAGQTAGNIEKVSRVRGYDRRVFQDGIYITKKPGENN